MSTIPLIILIISIIVVVSSRHYMRTHPMEFETQFMINFMVIAHIIGWIGVITAFAKVLFT